MYDITYMWNLKYGTNEPIYDTECVCVLSHLSHVRLCAALWTAACQALMSMGFSRQKYWRGLPYPPPGDLPDPGIEPTFEEWAHKTFPHFQESLHSAIFTKYNYPHFANKEVAAHDLPKIKNGICSKE